METSGLSPLRIKIQIERFACHSPPFFRYADDKAIMSKEERPVVSRLIIFFTEGKTGMNKSFSSNKKQREKYTVCQQCIVCGLELLRVSLRSIRLACHMSEIVCW